MVGVGRNYPCPCGSGIKFKKCCFGKYPRQHTVYIGFSEPFEALTFDNGQVYVHTLSGEKVKADYVSSQINYKGEKGKNKVTCCFPDKATLDIQRSLLDFDLIFAIDTNTKKVNGDSLSISSVFQCNGKFVAKRLRFRCINIATILFKNSPSDKPEKYSWTKLIKMITSRKQFHKLKIAIITDHDRDMHRMYNNNEIPIYGDIYMPVNITLLYAASDKGTGNIMNSLLIESDKESNYYFKQIKETGALSESEFNIDISQVPNLKDNKVIIILPKNSPFI